MERTLFTLLIRIFCLRMFDTRQHGSLRIIDGTPAIEGEYPYVVLFLDNTMIRGCSGSLITSEWVLTAGHCIMPHFTHIQYANFSVSPEISGAISPIIRTVKQSQYSIPKFNFPINDIALARVQQVPINRFGILSAIDYTSLTGYSVTFAGFGYTQRYIQHKIIKEILLADLQRPLQVGEGIAVSCDLMKEFIDTSFGPAICITTKCSNKDGGPGAGDSGGPLFYDNKIIGVTSFGVRIFPFTAYTAISPHLTWIHNVLNS